MKHLDLFSGIGGFALAAEMVWPDIEHTFCDNEAFSQAVLQKHWPQSKIYGDIRTLTTNSQSREPRNTTKQERGQDISGSDTKITSSSNTRGKKSRGVSNQFREESIEVGDIYLLTGGFPCQPFSQAGARRGTEDDRHLWPEMLRVIREFHPRWIIGENVGGLVTWSEGLVLEQIHLDLEGEGYEVQAFIIPAVAVNAPHRRDRVWIVAHSKHNGARHSIGGRNAEGSSARATGSDKNATDTNTRRHRRHEREGDKEESTARDSWECSWLEVATRLCRVDDGIPRRLDRASRFKALGNAIVPQVAEEIMKVIKEIDN